MSKTGFYKGRLGIGLTSTMGMGDGNPRYPLDINGDIRLTGAIVNGDGLALNMVNPDSMWNVGSNIISYSAGNVGIGTTSPSQKLHVHSTDNVANYAVPQVLITADPASNYNQWASLELRGSYIGNTVPYGVGIRTTYGHDSNYRTYGDFSIYTSDRNNGNARTDRLTVTSTGNVGIGTSPGGKLHTVGSSGVHALRISGNSGNSSQIYANGSNYGIRVTSAASSGSYYSAFFEGSSGKGLYVRDDGNVGIGTTSPYAKLQISGTSTNPSTSTQSSTSSQGILRLHGTGGLFMDFGFLLSSPYTGWIQTHNGTTNGTGDDLALQPVSGNVGIGTTSPNAKLDVNGNIYANGLIYLSTHVQHIGDNDTKIGFNGDDQYEVRVGGVQAFQCEKFNSYSVVRFGGATATGWGVTFPSPLGCYSRGKMYVAHDFVVTGDCHLATSSGKNVGIGTTSPSQKLDIEGQGGNGTGRIRFTDTENVTNARNWFMGPYRSNDAAFQIIPSATKGGTSPDTTKTFCIEYTGNVGIGTTSPEHNLQVIKPSPGNNYALSDAITSIVADVEPTYGKFGMYFGVNQSNGWSWIQTGRSGTSTDGSTGEQFNLILQPTTGNVGIGTTSPEAQLQINQSVAFTNPYVETSQTSAIHLVPNSASSHSAITFAFANNNKRGVGAICGSSSYGLEFLVNRSRHHYFYGSTTNVSLPATTTNDLIMIMRGDNKRVGIGTTSPACGLQVGTESPDPGLGGSIKFGRFMGAGYREYFPSSGTYASFSTDNHGSFTIGNNCHIDTNNNIEYNNTHGTMKGPAICMPGNAQPHQGSIIFYTADPGSVTAGHTFKTIGNTPTMHLDHNGYVGINEGAPEAQLHIYSGIQCMRMVVPHAGKYFQTNFYYGGHHIDVYYHGSTKGFGSSSNGGTLHLNYYSGGTVTVSGGTNATSDDRIKHNEKIITNGLDIINQLEPKKYFKSLKRYDEDHNYDLDSSGNPITDDDYKIETGLIAQQVMIIDDLKYTVDEVEDKYKTVEKETLDENGDVILDDDGKPVIEKKEEIALKGRYTVKYQDIFVYNIAATQELYKENQELKTEVATLKSELAAIKQHLGI